LAFAFLPILQGTQLWVKFINQKGGLNGHQVKLLVYDDGGDPARHRAMVQEAVEGKKVLGFLQNGEAVSGGSSVGYIESKRVPVMGGSTAEAWANNSPMYFPQSTVGEALARTFVPSIAKQMIPKGKKKLGSLICVEADTCNQTDEAIARDAKAGGFDHVYRARSTVAQPDFTAECLAARNAGVEVLFVALDQASLGRVGRACGRQAYKPVFAMCGPCSADFHKEDPNLDGSIAESTVFPDFQTGTPATDEFQQAFAALGKGLGKGSGIPLGWVTGKLLEKAGANLPEPPTTQALLEGLWTIKSDTLGGLTAPLNFTRDKPPAPVACWFAMAIANSRWTSPDNFNLNCL
jgi:branched-chain amino acid transport system substrate-binding protein